MKHLIFIFIDFYTKKKKRRALPGKRSRPAAARLTALLVAVTLLAGLVPFSSRAQEDGEEKVILTDLEELDLPETWPAKGTLCLQVARSKHITEDGGTVYQYEEGYLPVLVTQDHSVYGELDTLAGLLGMKLYYDSESVSVTWHETRVMLAAGDTVAGFVTPLYSILVPMGRASVVLDGKWYVPLDAFLDLTGTLQKYGETNWMGKQQLNLIPPQRTVLDDIGAFYRDAYSRYAFSYVKDLGYTEEQAAELAGQTSVIQYVYGVGSLDLRTWLAIAFGGYTDLALKQWENRYAERFMNDLLQENEEITAKLLENHKKELDYMGCMLDICMSVQESAGKQTGLAAADVQKALAETKAALATQGEGTFLADFGRYATAFQNTATVLSHLYSMISLGLTFRNADEQMVNAAKLFYNNHNLLSERTVRDDQYWFVDQKIKQFGGFLPETVVDQFIVDNGGRLLLDAAAMAGYGAAKKAFLVDIGGFEFNWFMLIAFLVLIASYIVLYKTRFGLRLCACGEHPQAADSVGINVYKMRYAGVLISGALGGLGGLVYITAGVSEWKFENGVAGFGFLALAVMIFGQWRPVSIGLAALLFGLFRALSNVYTGFDVLVDLKLPSTVYNMLPYIISLLVLAFVSKKSRAPKAEGIPYDKGQR